MVHYSIYVEDELATKIEEEKKVRHNRSSSQVIREILYHFFEKNTDISVIPSPAPFLDPNFDWQPLPEMPGCVKTREMWDAWVDGYRGLNRTNEKSGDPTRWIIPDEPPKGLK